MDSGVMPGRDSCETVAALREACQAPGTAHGRRSVPAAALLYISRVVGQLTLSSPYTMTRFLPRAFER